MYRHIICTVDDEEIFYKQCNALEKHIPNLVKVDLLQDVDGTLIQEYKLKDKTIIVKNDCYIGVVSIETEVDIEPYFNK